MQSSVCIYSAQIWLYLYEDNIIGTGSLLQDSNLYCYSIELNSKCKHDRQQTLVI